MGCDNCDKPIFLPYHEGLFGANDYKNNPWCLDCEMKLLSEDKRMDRLSKIHFASLNQKSYSVDLLRVYNPYDIRFINPQCEFDFAEFGSYFFHNGELYVITQKQSYEKINVSNSLRATYYYNFIKPNDYIIKGAYAGHDTGFIDDNHAKIYTGDIIRTKGTYSQERDPHKYFLKDRYIPKENDYLYECYGVVSSYTFCLEAYQVALDNNGAFLCHSCELEILGNIFYDLIPDKPIDIWKEACSLAQSGHKSDGFWNIHTRDYIKDDLKKIKTPSFKPSFHAPYFDFDK